MFPRVVSMAAVLIGILLFSASFFWPSAFKSHGWTDEQARELAVQRGHLHNLYGKQAHESGNNKMAEKQLDELKRQIAEAREEEAKQSAEFKSARYFRFGVPVWLKWIGVLLAIGGAAGVLLLPKEA
jgi:hypothetical protein